MGQILYCTCLIKVLNRAKHKFEFVLQFFEPIVTLIKNLKEISGFAIKTANFSFSAEFQFCYSFY